MKRHNRTPKVTRPSGRRRLVEWGKDLLIVLLTCSALYLLCQTPMVTHFRELASPVTPTAETETSAGREALIPYAIRVNNSLGSYGTCYDADTVTQVFRRFIPFLGEALSTAGEESSITAHRWQLLLERTGVYCKFQGSVSLAVLSSWLGAEETPFGNADAFLLAVEGDHVILARREDRSFYAASATMADLAGFEELLKDFAPNGAAFAYSLATEDVAYAALDDYVLLTSTTPQPRIYTALNPDWTTDRESLGQLLTAIGFLSTADAAYETPDGLIVTENGDRLLFASSGSITFRAGDESRYPIHTMTREAVTAAKAAEAAWELLCRATEPFEGTPAYVLTGVEETENGWCILFEGRLDGFPLTMGETTWCARFTTEGTRISEFTLTLRQYTAAEETTLLPSARLAAAALRSLSGTDGTLMLAYEDTRSSTLTAGWMTGEQE